MKNTNQRALEDLRYRVQEFGKLLQATTDATYLADVTSALPPFDQESAALKMVDACIDEWNWIINHAPKALKNAKVELAPELFR